VVKDAKRSDTGPYTVVLKNPSGSADATVKVTVIGTLLDFVANLFNSRHTIHRSSNVITHSLQHCCRDAN